MYTLSTNEIKNTPCLLSISRNNLVFSNNGSVATIYLFAISSNVDWTLQLVSVDGAGTDWIILNTMSGSGAANITAQPSIANTTLPISLQIRVNYCGVYQTFTLTQQKYRGLISDEIIIIN